MSDKFLDDYDEEASYSNAAPIHAPQHPHARMGGVGQVPSSGVIFSADDPLPTISPEEALAQAVRDGHVMAPPVPPRRNAPRPTQQAAAPETALKTLPNAPEQYVMRPPQMVQQPVQSPYATQAPQAAPQSPLEAVAAHRRPSPQEPAQQASAPPQQAPRPQQRPAQPQPQPQPQRTMQFSPTPDPRPVREAAPMVPGADLGYQHPYDPQQVQPNPLARYQRMPGLSIRLPTDGRFLPQGSVDFTMDGKVLVYPMRAADELLMKSPDALMSGVAVESLLLSCVPGIKYPRMISNPDLDVLFLAIKAASNGNMMPIEYACPVCKGETIMEIDLRSYLGSVLGEMPDNAITFDNGMVVYVRPYNLHNATQMSLSAYNEARAIQAAEANGTSEAQMIASYRTMTELDIAMTADCVIQIVVPEGAVNDKKQIMEFIPTMKAGDIRKIGEVLTAMNQAGLDKNTPVECMHCHHQWTTQAEFDPASFFAANS